MRRNRRMRQEYGKIEGYEGDGENGRSVG